MFTNSALHVPPPTSEPGEFAKAESQGAPVWDAGWGLRHLEVRVDNTKEDGQPEPRFVRYCTHGAASALEPGLDMHLLPASTLSIARMLTASFVKRDVELAVVSYDEMSLTEIDLVRRFNPTPDDRAALKILTQEDDGHPWMFKSGRRDQDGDEYVRESHWLAWIGPTIGCSLPCDDFHPGGEDSAWFGVNLRAHPRTGFLLPPLRDLRISTAWELLERGWVQSGFGVPVRLPDGRTVALDLRAGRLMSV